MTGDRNCFGFILALSVFVVVFCYADSRFSSPMALDKCLLVCTRGQLQKPDSVCAIFSCITSCQTSWRIVTDNIQICQNLYA